MRRSLFPLLLALPVLVACQLALPGGKDAPQPAAVGGDAISTTSLDVSDAPPAEAGKAAEKAPAPALENAAADAPRMTEGELAKNAPAAAPEKTEAAIEAAAAAAAPPPPEPVKSPSQIACEKKGGRYSAAGEGVFACVTPTRDAGKQCSKEGDCQGLCLARSRSCSPFTPVFGCQEILQRDGRQVTECLSLN
ncbi:MAG: hypothetical protein DI533_06545 [Cereibacter sphaeroides]|uniref:Uncharacterized protein n=1 Tax=Cereibacter sphaeroides TaxID=1063 RepID=A0A2W5UR25_CERSP|nr:MAG: hypothetical protein DI533_06545 [Cereibacter sphaeroides]